MAFEDHQSVFDDLKQSQQALTENPENHRINEFKRLCYELFIANEHGVKLLALMKEMLLLAAYDPRHPAAGGLAQYNEAVRTYVMSLEQSAKVFQKQINSQTAKESAK